jgi:hypothetical protein
MIQLNTDIDILHVKNDFVHHINIGIYDYLDWTITFFSNYCYGEETRVSRAQVRQINQVLIFFFF